MGAPVMAIMFLSNLVMGASMMLMVFFSNLVMSFLFVELFKDHQAFERHSFPHGTATAVDGPNPVVFPFLSLF